jgi:uncharacterized protein (TIGR04255 family)
MADLVRSYTRSKDLPVFERAPVTEVNIGVQFQGVKLQAVQLGALHARFAKQYPVVEEHLPPPLQIEQFQRKSPSGIHFQVQLLDRPPLPMLVFLAEDRASLVQVDNSRFFCAWRRSSQDVTYPRYEALREEFIRNLTIFDEFTTELGLEDKPVTQAEIAYVNDIPVSDERRPDILFYGLPTLSGDAAMSADEVSAVSTAQHFTYRTLDAVDYARLHISAEPVVVDSEKALRLVLVYRGEPHERFSEASGISTIMRFLDEGHDRIVRAFTLNTTSDAHNTWGRIG